MQDQAGHSTIGTESLAAVTLRRQAASYDDTSTISGTQMGR
jgi:hypothetical protein